MRSVALTAGLCLLLVSSCTTTRSSQKTKELAAQVADADKDGVLDADDKCPSEAETVNGYKDGDGCPDAVPPKPQFKTIHYGVNSKDVGSEFRDVIADVAQTMKTHPSIRIRIDGHTDSYGTPAYNLDISKRRAETVKTWLVQKHGLDASRIETAGYGMTKPVASFDTREGRIANRRIEFSIVEGWPPKD